MVTEDTDVKELVRLVIATGLEIEESSEFLDKMSELVRKGKNINCIMFGTKISIFLAIA